MHAQLVRLAGFRMQRVIHVRSAGNEADAASPFDQRFRVGHVGAFVRLQSSAILVDMRPAYQRKRQVPVDAHRRSISRPLRRGERCQAFVGFDGFAILEQHLVRASRRRITYEHDDACGQSVQTVRRRDVRLVVPLAQPDQRGFAIPHAAWRGGEEMRLVDDDDVLVLVQNLIFEGNMRFLEHVTVPAFVTQR